MNVTQLARQVQPRRLDEELMSQERHPNVYAYASAQGRFLTRHEAGSGFLKGYERFGDELEEAIGTFETKSGASRNIARGLEDPWMVVGLRADEFSDDQRALVERLKPLGRGKDDILTSFASISANRLDEILEWLPNGEILYRHNKYSSWLSYFLESAVMRRIRYKNVPSVFFTMLDMTADDEDAILGYDKTETVHRVIGLLKLINDDRMDAEEAKHVLRHGIPMEYAVLL